MRTTFCIAGLLPLPFLFLLSRLIVESSNSDWSDGQMKHIVNQAYCFLGSDGGGDNTVDWAVLVATDGRRDFSSVCGCTDNLLSSPLGSGVSERRQGNMHIHE